MTERLHKGNYADVVLGGQREPWHTDNLFMEMYRALVAVVESDGGSFEMDTASRLVANIGRMATAPEVCDPTEHINEDDPRADR